MRPFNQMKHCELCTKEDNELCRYCELAGIMFNETEKDLEYGKNSKSIYCKRITKRKSRMFSSWFGKKLMKKVLILGKVYKKF